MLIWAGLQHVPGSAPLRWRFGNPTDLAELTPATATHVGRMLLEENTASVNHLYNEHHAPNLTYTYRHPRHTSWSIPELLNAPHCYQRQASEHPRWDSSGARAFCKAVQQRLIRRLPGYLDGPWAITTASIPGAGRRP